MTIVPKQRYAVRRAACDVWDVPKFRTDFWALSAVFTFLRELGRASIGAGATVADRDRRHAHHAHPPTPARTTPTDGFCRSRLKMAP